LIIHLLDIICNFFNKLELFASVELNEKDKKRINFILACFL